MCLILLNYKNESENYQLSETQGYQVTTYNEEYKKTSELSNSDLNDAYQRNYQKTTATDGSYLIKSAEWTDRQKGEGIITIQAAQYQRLENSSALYVATMCYAHGLTEDILVKNIKTLTKYYTKVEFIAINDFYAEGILNSKTFTQDSTEDEIRLYVSEVKNSGIEYPHLTYSIPYAIQEYLFGNAGDEYISEENLKNNPTAIYTSFDSFYLGNTGGTTASSGWGAEYGTEKYFNFIEEHFANRYFSMSLYSRQEGKQCIGVRYPFQKYEASRLNVLLGILNPENYGEADLVYSEESLNKWQADNSADLLELPIEDKKYLADYSYSQDFEETGVQVITSCTIEDTVQDYFEIVDVNATGGSTSMQTKVTGQNVLFYDTNYVSGTEIKIQIKIKINQEMISSFDRFEDTNVGKATLNGNESLSVDSPKLATIYRDGYKPTIDITEEDKKDENQKNYQETISTDGSYLTKKAEWTDKEKGEALITLQGVQYQELENTTALYVATMCYQHGLSEDILVKNIQTLIKYYDKVDFIAINGSGESGISNTKEFTKESTEDEIRNYIVEIKNLGINFPHAINSIPFAIQKYLFGNVGDEYISEKNLINDPTAIYVSTDTYVLCEGEYNKLDGLWGTEYATEKYFEFITERYGNRYFSMSQQSKMEENPKLNIRYIIRTSYDANVMNILIGILNPENYGEADLVLSEESLKKWEETKASTTNTDAALSLPFEDKKYAADYNYSQDFDEAGVQIITDCTITDTVQDYFEIVDVDASGGSDSMSIKVNGQNVLFYDENYVYGNEVTIKIKVKLRDDVISHFDGFIDTNLGKATLSGKENMSVDSPKLSPITTAYTVNYLEKGTNNKLSNAKTDENIPITTQIKATDQIIDINGYNYDSADKAILTLGTGENVINLYYTKRTDLSYKVNYLEKDTNKVLSAQKVVNNQTFDTVVNSKDEIITIYGYNFDSSDKTSMKIGTGENVINLYYTKKDTSVVVHHYIDGTQNKVPSKNGGEVEDETITGKVDDKYSTNASSNIANNYELITSKLPTNASGTMTEEQIVVTYYYQVKEPTLESNINKTSILDKVTSKDQEIPYTITYTANVDTYIGNAEVTIVDTLPYKIDTTKSDIAGGTYNETNKTITWKENITDIDTFANVNKEIKLTKEIKLVYKDLDVNQPNVTNIVTGNINLKTPEKTDIAEVTKDIPTEFLKNIKVTKVWNDNSNSAGKRPTSVTVILTGNGKTYKQSLSNTNDKNTWEYTFADLPKYDTDGNEIDYVLSEESLNNKFYVPSIDQENKTITNTFTVPDEKVSVKITKVWNDNNNSAQKRPANITIKVTGNKTENIKQIDSSYATKEDSNKWEYTFTDLPKYDVNGNEITYTIDEQDLNSEFYTKSSVNQETRTIVNTFQVPGENIEIPVTKVWDDNNNVAQKRPTSVTLQIKNGEIVVAEEIVTESDGWKYTFSVPKYDVNGDKIKYTIDEADLNNKFYTRENTVINQENRTITNKFVVPDEKTTVTVTKIWDDNNNEAKKRPTSVTLQVKNGTEVIGEATVTEESGWKHNFTLTRYDSNGNDINYTVDEADLNNKYYEKGNIDQTARTITNVSKYGKVVVHYYIMNTDGTKTEMKVPDVNENEIADSIVEGAQGEEYTTNPATNVQQNYELVETPTNATGTITKEDTEVIYYYRLKTPNITNQNTTKTGTDRITVANQEMSYTVTYTANVTDYIGNAEVTIVDTLPYAIDEGKSDLAGGTYDSASKTITWKENVSDINSYSGAGTVSVTKTFKVVYIDLDMNQEKVTNNVKGNIKLLTPEKTSDEVTGSQDSTIYKAIISSEKLVDKTEATEGEKVTYTIRIKNDGNLAKTVTVRDILPAGITFDKDTLIQVGDTGTVYTEQNLKNGIPVEVPAEGSIDVVFAGKVDTLANNEYSKTLTNQATVDNEPTNEVTTEVTKANITAHKESDPSSGNKVREGDEITYRIRVRNDGTRAGDVIVKDIIPTGTTFVEGSIKIDNVAYSTKTATDLQNGITLNVPISTEKVVEFKVKVNKQIDGTKIKNTAYINQNGEDKKVPEEPEHTYVEPKEEQSISKNGTATIESLDQEITYNISYTARITDYRGRAAVKLVDKLPYAIDEAKSDLAGGTYDAQAQTITWEETVEDIQLTEEKEVTINKIIKVVYTGINQGTTAIKNIVTGQIEYETQVMTSDEVTANSTTTTGFTVNVPVSKVWEDDSNKLGQRPTKVVFKLHGSDRSEYTLELAKPGTQGSTTTQDSTNPNKWNDIFENLPKYDSNNQEIVYTLTEEEKTEGDLKYYDSVVTDKTITNTNKYGKVTVHHYIMNTDGTTTTTRVPDAQGQDVQDTVIEGKEGNPYTTEEAKNINEKYELVEEKLPANATGTIEKYNEEKPQEVIYYYRLKPSKVLINYLEKDSNEVLSTQERITGYVDNSYNTNIDHRKETIQKDGKTYTLVKDSGNTDGIMTVADTTVTYYYLQNTKATVRYVERDPETGDIVKDLEEPTVKEGLVGDKFVTNEKAFIGYKLVEEPEHKTINMTKEEQTLIYYYEPVYTGLIENHIDDKTGKILETKTYEIQVGQDYNIPSKEFEGYDLVEEKLPANAEGTMGEEVVTVNYYYIKKAVLEVNYIDIYTNKPLIGQIVDNTKHEGDLYTTEQKTFENYDLVEVPSNASGTIEVETDEEGNITNNRTVVTYYYTQRAIIEEHHIDILTGKDIEEPTIHNGHVGDKYDIPSKEFLSYKLIEEDEEGNSMLPTNSQGIMTAEKIVVNYYYNQPAKVIVHYVEKTTGKELEETNPETGELQQALVVIEGFNQDEYETTAKEFEYYTLIESPTEPNGTMKVEITKDEEGNDIVNNTIELYYYYEAKPFNIGVEKEITGIIVNGERRTPTNGKLEKVEIYRKAAEDTSVQIEYKIKVSNTGEVSGNATIEENIPEGMSLANNDGTWEEQEGKLIKVIPEIGAGETKEYTVLLNWEQTGENMGEKANEVKLVETGNVPGFVDNNDKDNTSNANVIISVETGELPIGLILALVGLIGLETITLRYAVVLTKRQKRSKKQNVTKK